MPIPVPFHSLRVLLQKQQQLYPPKEPAPSPPSVNRRHHPVDAPHPSSRTSSSNERLPLLPSIYICSINSPAQADVCSATALRPAHSTSIPAALSSWPPHQLQSNSSRRCPGHVSVSPLRCSKSDSTSAAEGFMRQRQRLPSERSFSDDTAVVKLPPTHARADPPLGCDSKNVSPPKQSPIKNSGVASLLPANFVSVPDESPPKHHHLSRAQKLMKLLTTGSLSPHEHGLEQSVSSASTSNLHLSEQFSRIADFVQPGQDGMKISCHAFSHSLLQLLGHPPLLFFTPTFPS
jgi:hypothetical protein